MARFQFNLQVVMKQRLAVERQKQLAVALIEQQRLSLEDEIRGYNNSLQREKSDLREALTRERVADYGRGVDLRGVRMQASAALHLVGKAQQAVLRLAAVHKRLDAARVELLAATKARKGVETLRDRRYEAWALAEKQAEAGVLDELAVMRTARTRDEFSVGQGDEIGQEAA